MVKYNKIIIVSGLIGSGKTTLAKKISNEYNCIYISFGDYIRDVAKKKNIYPNRFNLQELGKNMIETLGDKIFINKTISFFLKNYSSSKPIIIDGVRHINILKDIKSISNFSFVIFIDVDKNVLLRNIINRDKKKIKDIEKWLNHKTESQINEIKDYADLIVRKQPLEDWARIKLYLNKIL